MFDPRFWTVGHAAGSFLVLSSIVLFPGLMMFWIRGGHRGGAPPTPAYFVWERSLIMVAVILTAVGLMLLTAMLQNTAGRILAQTGVSAYLFAGILGVTGEALGLTHKYQNLYPIIVIYVVVAFLAEAAIGGSLLQAGLLAAWIGWGAIAWNLVWLVVLPLLTPRDIYFPVLHHVATLLIGIGLLLQVG